MKYFTLDIQKAEVTRLFILFFFYLLACEYKCHETLTAHSQGEVLLGIQFLHDCIREGNRFSPV